MMQRTSFVILVCSLEKHLFTVNHMLLPFGDAPKSQSFGNSESEDKVRKLFGKIRNDGRTFPEAATHIRAVT